MTSTPPSAEERLEAVLAHVKLGYPFLPLHTSVGDGCSCGWRPSPKDNDHQIGKHPRTPRGKDDATTDPDIIRKWWSMWPDANWGLLPPEQVLVLDFDRPEAWPELLKQYPELASAPRQRTPRGGYHVFLRLPAEAIGKLTATCHRLPGVDMRGMGRAYVVVAPSVIKGVAYVWEVPLTAPDELPEVPAALLERLLPPPPPPAPAQAPTPVPGKHHHKRLEGLLEWAAERVAATPEGARHNTLLEYARLVGGWLHHGLDEAEALEALTHAGMRAGLPEAEARTTARDGLEYGKQAPLPLPPDDKPLVSYARLSLPKQVESDTEVSCTLEGLAGGGEVMDGHSRYIIRNGLIQAARVEGKGESRMVNYWPLANFACTIAREVRATDGLETETLFELEGYLATGQPLPRALVSASEFAGMAWVAREWGSEAIVTPTQGAKDHLRAAIQYLSQGRTKHATVYRHLGWTKIANRWHYLHAGGAIAAEEPEQVEVHPGRILEGFHLPEPPSSEAEPGRIHTLWGLLNLAPHRVTVPLLLYALAAPLGHAPYSLYLAGPTGVRKTSLALVIQSLFGYTGTTPPLGWEATPNSLEGAAFAAKDALLLVDDYAPTGHERTQKELQSKAARLLRSQGNAVGRLRMRADGSLAGDRPPRGSLLVTGEDLPPGHSVRARALFLELRPGDVDLSRLSEAQHLAREGVYAEAMAGWIRHLAGGLEQYKDRLRERVEELRPRWAAEHGRTTDALARLHATWELYRDYAALWGVDLTGHESEVLAALEAVRDEQANYHRDADPVQRFLALLPTALRMGRCHLVPLDGKPTEPVNDHLDNPAAWGWQYRPPLGTGSGTWQSQGPCIGWLPADWEVRGLYLDPSAAWTVINRLAAEQGEPLPSERTLWRRLAERGVIRTQGEANQNRHLARMRIQGQLTRVLHLLAPYIPDSGNKGNTPEKGLKDRENPVPFSSGVPFSEREQAAEPVAEAAQVFPFPKGNSSEKGNSENPTKEAKTAPVPFVPFSGDIGGGPRPSQRGAPPHCPNFKVGGDIAWLD